MATETREYHAKQLMVWAVVISGFFLIGFGCGYWWIARKKSIEDTSPLKFGYEVRKGGYKFVNPLLECDLGQEYLSEGVAFFREPLADTINSLMNNHTAMGISVYFRDLNNGPWIGFDEKKEFIPASLLKVPVMMTVYRLAESNPGFLEQQIELTKGTESFLHFFPGAESVKKDIPYSVDELVNIMIKNSDNIAASILKNIIGEDELKKTFYDLGIIPPGQFNEAYTINIRNFGSFFRVLFNASYLSIPMSEKALELLSQSTFKAGLPSGVSRDILVSHKFGERADLKTSEKQLHDCGIIYYPGHPYLLCVMTIGNNFEKLVQAIHEISVTVYQNVDKQFRGQSLELKKDFIAAGMGSIGVGKQETEF